MSYRDSVENRAIQAELRAKDLERQLHEERQRNISLSSSMDALAKERQGRFPKFSDFFPEIEERNRKFLFFVLTRTSLIFMAILFSVVISVFLSVGANVLYRVITQ